MSDSTWEEWNRQKSRMDASTHDEFVKRLLERAVYYLHDDFKDGQFLFARNNQSEHGRLVAFNAGDFHGVRAVRQGQRCAIAMWYTHDLNYYEVSRINARRKLDKTAKTGKTRLDNDMLQDIIEQNTLIPDVLKADLENGLDKL